MQSHKAPPGSVEPHQALIQALNSTDDWRTLYSLWLLDSLNSVAEAIGALRAPNVEVGPALAGMHDAATRTADQIVDRMDTVLGVNLFFPTLLRTNLAWHRAAALSASARSRRCIRLGASRKSQTAEPISRSWKLAQGLAARHFTPHCSEIKNYTIIDIPLTNAAQGYFLGRTLGAEAVRLEGELEGRLIIIPSSRLETNSETYNLVVNVNSLDRNVAGRCDVLLAIREVPCRRRSVDQS